MTEWMDSLDAAGIASPAMSAACVTLSDAYGMTLHHVVDIVRDSLVGECERAKELGVVIKGEVGPSTTTMRQGSHVVHVPRSALGIADGWIRLASRIGERGQA